MSHQEQQKKEVIALFNKYEAGLEEYEILDLMVEGGYSYQAWDLISQNYIPYDQRADFMAQITIILKLDDGTNPQVTPAIIKAYEELQPLTTLQLKDIFIISKNQSFYNHQIVTNIDQDVKKRIYKSIEGSQNIQQYLTKEVTQIIDLLHRRYSFEKYFRFFSQSCREIENIFTQQFGSMKLLDFIILLIKFVNSDDSIMFLLSLQVPVSIMVQVNKVFTNDIKPCRSFLDCKNYSLITNVGTKSTLKINKNLPINTNSIKIAEGTIFENNLNLSLSDTTKAIMDFYGQFQNTLDTLNNYYRVTSMFVLHLTQQDLTPVLENKNITNLFQSIEKLALIIWDGQQPQKQVQKQVLSVLKQDSIIKKSIKNRPTQTFIYIKNTSSQTPQLLNKQTSFNNFLKSSLKLTKFRVQDFYNNEQDKISTNLKKYSKQPLDKLFPWTQKKLKSGQISPFVNETIGYIQNVEYSQFAFAAQKLASFYTTPITPDNIIYQLSLYNEVYIDRKKQRQSSFQQDKINKYYSQCIQNVHPFNVINDQTSVFGNGSLQRFFNNEQQNKQKEEIFIISLIGTKSNSKKIFINNLFRYNFYSREYPLLPGIYMSICEIDNKFIIIFNTEEFFNESHGIAGKNLTFYHKIVVFLLKISNLVLITNFSQYYKKITESLSICSFIYEQICQNNDQISLSKVLLALPKSNSNQIGEFEKSLSALNIKISEQDVFFVPQQTKYNKFEELPYSTQGFRNYIVNNLKKPANAIKRLVDLYRNLQVQWDMINTIGQNYFQASTYSQLQQQTKLTAKTQDKKNEENKLFISRTITAQKKINVQLNSLPSQDPLSKSLTPQVKYQNVFCNSDDLINKLKLLQSNGSNTESQQYNKLIEQLYWNTYEANTKQISVDQIMIFSQKSVKTIYKENLDQDLDNLIYKNQGKSKIFLEDYKSNKKLIAKDLIRSQLLKTFQIILASYEILKGIKINNINQCVSYFYDVHYDTNIYFKQFVAVQNELQLKQQNRAELYRLFQKSIAYLMHQIQLTYSKGITKEIDILNIFQLILVTINKYTQSFKQQLNKYFQNLQIKYIFNQINYKRLIIGNVFDFFEKLMVGKKQVYFNKKVGYISSIVDEIVKIDKEIYGIREQYLTIKAFSYARDVQPFLIDITTITDTINIVGLALKDSIQANLKMEKVKPIEKPKPEPQPQPEPEVKPEKPGLKPKPKPEEKEKEKENLDATDDKNEQEDKKRNEFTQTDLIQLKGIYKNCYKIVVNSSRYLNHIKDSVSNIKLYTKQLEGMEKNKRQLLGKELEKIKKFLERVGLIYRQNLYKDAYQQIINVTSSKQDEIRLQINNQKSTVIHFQKLLNKSLSQSICNFSCSHCKALCTKKGHHLQGHQIRHYLQAYGGHIDKAKDTFSLQHCGKEKGIKYDFNQLANIWINIEDAMIATQYKGVHPTTQPQVLHWKNEACLKVEDTEWIDLSHK